MADWMSGVASVVGNIGGAWGQAAGYDPAYGLQSLYQQTITAGSANAFTFNLAPVTQPQPETPTDAEEIAWLKKRVRDIEWRP